jgi:hypothetical protein
MPYRIAAVIYFLLMPNLTEGYVNITNVHRRKKDHGKFGYKSRTNSALPKSDSLMLA